MNMNTDVFETLTLEEQRDFLNKELAAGKSLTKISKEISISRKTFTNRMKKINHVLHEFEDKTKQYIPSIDAVKAPKKKVIKKETDNTLIEIFTDSELKNNLINLAMNYNKIQALIDKFENNNINEYEPLINDKLRLKLINEREENVRTTIQINRSILDDFNLFCSHNKDYQKQDIISTALYEFLEKRNFYLDDKNFKESL